MLWVRWILVVAGLSVAGACAVSPPHKAEPSVSTAHAPSPPAVHPAPPPISEVISLGDSDDKKPLRPNIEMYPGTGTFVKPKAVHRAPPNDVGGEYTLNFEATDFQEVVKAVLGDLLKESYFIDPKVTGRSPSRPAGRSNAPSFADPGEPVAPERGVAAAFRRPLQGHAGSPSARGSPPASVTSVAAARGFGIRVVPLRYVSARELHKLIEPFLPPDAPQIVDEQRNLLILTGTEQELQATMELVELFDVDWLNGMSVGLYKLKDADVKTLHGEMEKIFGDKDSPVSGVVRMVPVERLNALLVVSSRPGYLEHARNGSSAWTRSPTRWDRVSLFTGCRTARPPILRPSSAGSSAPKPKPPNGRTACGSRSRRRADHPGKRGDERSRWAEQARGPKTTGQERAGGVRGLDRKPRSSPMSPPTRL